VLEAQLKKWRHAGPLNPHPERAVVVDVDAGRLIFAGDAFGGPKVEGAFNSGQAAGEAARGR
jgi:renalase